MNKKCIFVTYDSITHSVFDGQVMQPLIQQKQNYTDIIIISFEKTMLTKQTIKKHIPKTCKYHILKKYPFMGRPSLIQQILQLRTILKTYKNYELIARGPLAGYISYQAKPKEQTLTIQARGLLAAEYKFSHNETIGIKKLWHLLRYYLYYDLERVIYSKKDINIESVSSALQDYLIKTYDAHPDAISIASNDIPRLIQPAQRLTWKEEIRSQLNIPKIAHVYCYNGSVHPWQCPDDVVLFFTKQLRKNKNAFLLVLTQDKKAFEDILKKYWVEKKYYKVLTIKHDDMYKYLSACDTGIIFRKPDVVSWVARPVKVLEYKATGLEIVHNNTVEILREKN